MTVKDRFDSMDYGPAPEDPGPAMAWLDRHQRRFGHFVHGAMVDGHGSETFITRNPATGEELATVAQADQEDVADAVGAARAAQPRWQGSPEFRARCLYSLARLIQKNSRLLSVLESLDNGKPLRESRDIDIPLVARHFYFHAGAAQLMPSTMPDRIPIGVCGQIIPWNFPLLMLAWKIAPAIAMGNTVVLKPAEYTPLTALLFAELSAEAGIPPGVINIITGDGRAGEMLVAHDQVDKIAFTGSTEVGRAIRRATAGSGKSLTLELGGKSPFIVFDDADLDSVVEGVVDAIWFNQGQVCCAGSRLLVQENVAEELHRKIIDRMARLRVGNPLDKSIDIGAIVDAVQLARIREMVDECPDRDCQIHQAPVELPQTGFFYPPTLITGLQAASRLMQEEIFGPVLVGTTFRTPAEAVELANNTRYGLAASVWSENINLALDIAPRLACGVVWINSTNLFDAAAGFGGRRESGFGREGGWEGLTAYTRSDRFRDGADGRRVVRRRGPPSATQIDRTAKHYIGGRQARPDSGYSRPVSSAVFDHHLGHAPLGNRKDIRNAVEAAEKARGWAAVSGHSRAQILYYIAENLSARQGEFARRIVEQTSVSARHGEEEVAASMDRLFTYAAWADKYDSNVHQVPMRGVVLAMREPVGVVGAICPNRYPLLGLVSVMAPLMAMGNTCILVPSEPHPLSATDFYQVLDTSDVPAGVVNIVAGDGEELARTLARHSGVDAVWSFGRPGLAKAIEAESAGNLKRCWVDLEQPVDWRDRNVGEGEEFLRNATEIKNVWIPYGE